MATLTSKLIVSLLDQVSGPAKGIGHALDQLQARARRTSSAFLGGGLVGGGAVRNLMAMGAGYIGVREGIGGTVGAALKFEEAFADVRKVVDGTPAQLSAIRSEILSMSKTLPVTADGIADIYAAAGQSNVPLQELGKFSEMAAKVSVAWDTSQGETGDALAKIKTQLGMNVEELGLHADAINHLSNNTASAARDLVDFDKRVAATGKMFGYSDTETLAFGASMVSAGAQSEVAATSFRNMGRALTMGERATKSQRLAMGKLGLDNVKVAKSMQKNALKTTLDVFERIRKLPEWQRASVASALFGDEARALMPVIADTRELRRELDMVASTASYSGSAFNEYVVRAETGANALQLLWNKVRGVGIGIGDGWLPTIKEFALGIGDVLDTLDQRVGIFDQIKASMTGFLGGIGYGGTGGVRELINDIGNLVFGEAFEGGLKQADERVIGLARLSNRFRGIGQDLKSFADNVSGANFREAVGNIGDAVSKMSGSMTVASALAIGLVGRGLMGIAAGAVALMFSPIGRIAMVATAVATLIEAVKGAESLGEFIENLKGLSVLEWAGIGAGLLLVAERAARVVGWFRKLGAVTPKVSPAPTPAAPPATPAIAGGGFMKALGLAGITGLWATLVQGLGETPGDNFQEQVENQRKNREALQRLFGSNDVPAPSRGGPLTRGRDRGDVEREHSLDAFLRGSDGSSTFDGKSGPTEVTVAVPVTTQPSGVQDVRIMNPMPAPVVNITINAQTNASAGEIATATERALSARLDALSQGSYSDGAN